jgi:amino acid adenylation domain-containing protein
MNLSSDRLALLEMLIRGKNAAATPQPQDPPPREEQASHAQRRLWFVEQLQQNESPYTLHAVRNLNWVAKPELLQQALDTIVRRHEVLRTVFAVRDGEPVQRILAENQTRLEFVDCRGKAEAFVREHMTQLISRRFDLERGPLLKAVLYRMDGDRSTVLFVVHHIVFDGPSFPILFKELEAIYGALASGKELGVAPVRTQYGAYARAQQNVLTPARIEEEVAFWRHSLEGFGTLDLPLDRPRPAVPAFQGSLQALQISPEICAQLQQAAAAHRTTLFVVLLAAVSVALSRICGQTDFAIGIPVTGRDSTDLRDAIGFFVDTVVVRCRLQGNPALAELVDRLRAEVAQALAHRALPFETLVERLRPPREFGTNPIFQVGMQLMHQEGESAPGEDTQRGAMFDLSFNFWYEKTGLGGRLEYNAELFDPSTIEFLRAAFAETLKSFKDPGRTLEQVDLLSQGSTLKPARLEGEVRPTAHTSFPALWRETAERFGTSLALDAPGVQLSYGELFARANGLAEQLECRGVSPGSFVILALPRSAELLWFALGVWQAGAAFVFLDPSWPEARREKVLQNSNATLVITEAVARELSWVRSASAPREISHGSRDAAYVIYTSGSTGVPKGVVVEHGGLANVGEEQRRIFELGPGRRVAQLASPSFDASIFEMVLALGAGATLVIPPNEVLAGDALASFLLDSRVDTVVVPPSLLATIDPAAVPGLQLVCVAGETCPPDLADTWSTGREFWNLYGPTEATIWSTFGRKRAGGRVSRVSIGRPIANTHVSIVDPSLSPVPVGVAGELCIAGAGVAREYWRDITQTNQKFVEDPSHSGERMYRTGDLARISPDGELLFLGRVDRQVKIRGFRIEPGEIESILRRHEAVKEAVVIPQAVPGSEPVLVAYLQCASADPQVIDPQVIDACRRMVQDSLPNYMVPSFFVPLPQIPRTPGGKIDVESLRRVGAPKPADAEYEEPVTAMEKRVAGWMAQVTKVARVGASDDFFKIGGHSLAAAQLVAQARAALEIDLKIRDVFFHPKVKDLAARIEELERSRAESDEEPEAPLIRLPRVARQSS